jgi:DtxR family Mn-dependent transcriptional regulator
MTFSEENYLKTIYHLTTASDAEVSTNAIAEKMETKASSVTDMLKKACGKRPD